MSTHTGAETSAEAAAVVDLAAERATRMGHAQPAAPADHDGPHDPDADEDEDGRRVVDAVVDGVVVEHHGQAVTHTAGPGSQLDAGGAVATRALPSRPVVPPWMRDRESARSATVWASKYAAHSVGFHTVRLPVYWARLAGRSPVGVYRIASATGRWVFDADGAQVRKAMSAAAGGAGYGAEDAATWARLEEQRRKVTRTRAWLVAAALAALGVTAWVVLASVPGWAAVLVVAAALALLGMAGRDAAARVVSRYTDAAEMPRLSSDLLLTALGALGVAELNRGLRPGADGVRFPSPIARDGAGWRAEVDLPAGVTSGMIVDRRDRLAAGLRRPLSAVWPEGDSDVHEGRLIVWVGDKPMSKAKPLPWPLAAKGTVDLFAPFPFGADPRGRAVPITLMFASMVIGGQPRMGKSFLARLLLLASALDVRCALYLFDLKGSPDLLPLGQVAHAFRSGDEPEDMDYLLGAARELHQDLTRRNKTLRALPRDICPEGKITPELASRKDLGLHPVVMFIDECQIAFEHPTHGKELEAVITDLTKRGPSVGIIVICATQRPDAKSLPSGIRSNAVLRLCLRVQGQMENDMVLGTSAYKSGHRATMFARSERGVAYLSGEADDPQIVRAAYIDAVQAEKIAARARAARVTAGRLTGYAADQDLTPDDDTASIIDHLLAVWPATEDRAWCDTLAARLAEAFPSAYAGWTAENVTTAVKPHGLRTRQIKLDGQNRRGLRRDDLALAFPGVGQDAHQSRDPGSDVADDASDEPEVLDR